MSTIKKDIVEPIEAIVQGKEFGAVMSGLGAVVAQAIWSQPHLRTPAGYSNALLLFQRQLLDHHDRLSRS